MAEYGKHDAIEALRRSEERCSAFIRNSSEAIWLFELEEPVPTTLPAAAQIDAFYRLAYLADCNEAMAQLYGYQRSEELIGVRLGTLMPRDDPANMAYLEAFIAANHQLKDAESVELTREGRPKYLLNSLRAIVEEGSIRRAWGTSRDITPIKEAEERLRQSDARFRLIVESATDFVIMTADPQNRITSWNIGAERIFGYRPEEIMGQSGELLFTPEDRVRGIPAKEMLTAAAKGRAENERWHLKKNGERFWGSGYMMPILDGKGTVQAFLKIMRDGTAAREADEFRQRHVVEIERLNASLEERVEERTAELSEANGHLRAFAHTVAHDLRAPLRSAREFTGILLADYSAQLAAEAHVMLQRIQAATDRVDRLLAGILDYSRTLGADLRLESVALEEVVDDVVARHEAQIGRRQAIIQVAKPLPVVIAHQTLIGQVVENLFANALKFVPPQRRPEISIFAESVRDRVRLSIRDNGIGVTEEDREKIFGLFERGHEQREYPGTGVGLAIVQAAMGRMGGRVGLISEPGRGSTFWFELPRAGAGSRTPLQVAAD